MAEKKTRQKFATASFNLTRTSCGRAKKKINSLNQVKTQFGLCVKIYGK